MKRLLIFLLCLFPVVAMAGEYVLNWDAQSDATGFTLYWGTTSRSYTGTLDVGNVTTATLPGLPAADVYVSIKAYNSGGESWFGREVQGWPTAEVHDFQTDCTPHATNGVDCTLSLTGDNFTPGVQVDIQYPDVTLISTTRVDATSVSVTYHVASTAPVGTADLTVQNPWQVTPGTEIPGETAPTSGMTGPTFPDAITITPVMLPNAPLNLIQTH